MENLFKAFPQGSHPMAMLCSSVAAMSATYDSKTDITNEEDRITTIHRLNS